MIRSIQAAQRLDSRGNPTVQVDLTIDRGKSTPSTFRALVPSGASTGAHEATELRDNKLSVYGGKGVETAVQKVEEVIAPALIKSGLRVDTDQKRIDALLKDLDNTKNKSKLGANAILGVSMACARAGVACLDIPLYEFLRQESGAKKLYVMPVPFFNVLNGGVHSGNKMAFQETMIAPVGVTSTLHIFPALMFCWCSVTGSSQFAPGAKYMVTDVLGLHAKGECLLSFWLVQENCPGRLPLQCHPSLR
ncbi:uncharacterized protein ASPGLDRAFT_136436 [Aspergillus glaucus CBS 516.65]|uniref:phosphopyruvate hydratase n=1 Tax=Aspergillus glaucus CBS 516.65 TaxID=1160497 RepID=A0A1L9V6S2_ASPGL|nr:hypothetical protein ASPGLDRAFT_136436 [Aspergillus glaucus CBS 516.65]OJJ79620.1 hypothetical protein ASPGLDRAFT_136436 [Aspergillus glaucus CBS 516.65]